AEDGRKMSKHLGNILEPMPLMERHGADALRWFMLCSGSPWSARRVGHKALEEIASKVIRTYWSIASFQSLYARANDWAPPQPGGGPEDERAGHRALLDRWALARLGELVVEVDDALENFDTARAGKALSAYVDDLSNWYVRRSRRRFWDGDPAALATLHECLHVLTRLLAPFIPFVTETVWQALFAATGGVDSVHLTNWPTLDRQTGAGPVTDEALVRQVELVRRLVELGRAARADAKAKIRQPLSRALISAPGWAALPRELRAEVAEELNVQTMADLADTGELVDRTLKPNFRALGKVFGKHTARVAGLIQAAPVEDFIRRYLAGTMTVEVDGQTLPLAGDMVTISETPRSGWAVSAAGAETVALDLELTPQLRLAGLAREVVRIVQDARKAAGLEVTDRIGLWWRASGPGEVADAIRAHAAQLAAEVLASTLTEHPPADAELAAARPDGYHTVADETLGLRVWLRRAR
ncbi:MAG: DUF5915 domain-containing protein, partial [Actinomycetia bacterium]|nr:DUF5915 domain-containing protein [Actinomycetes bacterium]